MTEVEYMDGTVEHFEEEPVMEPLMTPDEVAAVLRKKSADWVYRAARNQVLPSVWVGRSVRFRRSDIEAFIANGGTKEEQ